MPVSACNACVMAVQSLAKDFWSTRFKTCARVNTECPTLEVLDAAVEILRDSMNQISQLVQSAAQCCIKNFQSRYSFDISDSDSDSYSSTCSHKIPVTRHQLPLQYQYTVTEPCRFAAAAEIPRETASSTWQWLLGAL